MGVTSPMEPNQILEPVNNANLRPHLNPYLLHLHNIPSHSEVTGNLPGPLLNIILVKSLWSCAVIRRLTSRELAVRLGEIVSNFELSCLLCFCC